MNKFIISCICDLTSYIIMIEIREEGVRITGKFAGLLGALFVYQRRVEGWG